MKKTIILIVLSVLFNSLFSQSIEPLRITHGPWLQNLQTDGVTVCWTTNLPAVPGILFTSSNHSTDSLIRNSTDGMIHAGGTLHKVRISGLHPGVKYFYRIHSVEIMKHRPYQIYYGDTITGSRFSFSTLNPVKDTTRFMVVSDIHTQGSRLAGFLKSGWGRSDDFRPHAPPPMASCPIFRIQLSGSY